MVLKSFFSKALACATAAAFMSATLAPQEAQARDRGHGGYGHYERGYGHGYGHRHRGHGHRGYHRRHHDDDNGDAIAAGIIGFALGALIVASANSNKSDPRRDACAGDYRNCGSNRAYRDTYYNDDDLDGGYYGESNYGRYDDYAPNAPARTREPQRVSANVCVREVEQYDPHTDRYVWVNLRERC